MIGCVFHGGVSVFRDIAAFVALAESGQMDLEILLGQRVGLADVRIRRPARSVPAGR